MPRREPHPIQPRLLTAEQAAAYLGYATTGLLAKIPVKPVQLAQAGPGSMPKYDRAALDAWLDQLSGLRSQTLTQDGGGEGLAEAVYAQWKARRAG